jgi:hypothetical protein
MVTTVKPPNRKSAGPVLENEGASGYHAAQGHYGDCYSEGEPDMPAVIANNRTAVLLFTALLMALAVIATVMLAKHGITHTGASAKFLYQG